MFTRNVTINIDSKRGKLIRLGEPNVSWDVWFNCRIEQEIVIGYPGSPPVLGESRGCGSVTPINGAKNLVEGVYELTIETGRFRIRYIGGTWRILSSRV